MNKRIVFCIFVLLMLLSGFAGISYEILYGRILGNIIGDQFSVSAAVLITFLLGIAFGSLYAHRLYRWLWSIEAGIGIFGLLIAFSQPWLEFVVYEGSSIFAEALFGSVAVCVVILIIPAFLIGCSVPLFSTYLSKINTYDRNSFSWVYMGYNFGAAFTALLIEFYLIRNLGIQGSVILFAAANMIVAVLLKLFFTDIIRNSQSVDSYQWKMLISTVSIRVLWALFFISIASAVFQLFMVKYSELIFGPFRESFALVLGIVLFGISLGSLIVARLKVSFSVLIWINLLSVIFLMFAVEPAVYIYSAMYPLVSGSFWTVIGLKFSILMALMLIPATTFGATIPALLPHKSEVGYEAGFLLFVSSIANVIGFLFMVFILHRYLDFGVQLLLIAVMVSIGIGIFYQFKVKIIVMLVLMLSVLGTGYWKQWDEDLLYLSYTNFKSLDRLNKARAEIVSTDRYKGYQDVFSINWMGDTPFFFINGYTSIPLNNPSEKVVGALSTLFSPKLDSALVLGLGSGATASTVGLFFDKTDVVEINPVVRKNLFRMKQWNFNIEHNPKVKIFVDDAIHYMKSGEETYSLVLNTVTTPLYFSSSKLYTSNFLQNVKNRLDEDGVYVTWMDSRVGDKGVDIILRTLQSNFKYAAVLYVKASYFLLLASDQPLFQHQQQAVVENKVLQKNLMSKHQIMSAWLPYQLMTTDAFSLIGEKKGQVNTANYPILEFEMAHLFNSGIPKFKAKLIKHLDIQELKNSLLFQPQEFPYDFLLHVKFRLKNSMITKTWNEHVLKEYGDDEGHNKDAAELLFRKKRMEANLTMPYMQSYAFQLIKLKYYKKALIILNAMLKRDATYDNVNYNIAVCYEKMGNFNLAIKFFNQEVKVDPLDEDVFYRLGRIYIKQGELDAALKSLNKYISSQKTIVYKAYYYRSWVHQHLGNSAAALKDLFVSVRFNDADKKIVQNLK